MNLDSEIHKMFFMVQKKIQQTMRDINVEFPLSRPEVMALRMIKEIESPTVSLLADIFNIRKPSVSILVHRLKKKGLVEFIVSENDKRIQEIHLTNKAESVLEEMKKVMKPVSDATLGMLNNEEKKELLRIMKKIVE